MRRFLSIILSIVLVITLIASLSACSEEKGVALFSDEVANFTLIRSKDADIKTMEITKNFRQSIIDTLGIKVDYKTDETKFQKGKLEINIGVTNRPEAQKIFEKIKTANENSAIDYAFVFKDDVIYIVGTTNIALENAVNVFFAWFCTDLKSTIAEDYEYFYHLGDDDGGFNIAGDTNLSDYKVVFPQYNMSYLVGREIDALCEELMLATGSYVEKMTDNNKATKKEIIVGETKCGNAPSPSNSDEFIIRMKGGKIYVNGANDECTAMALKELCRMAQEGETISKNFEYIGSYSESLKNHDNSYKLTWNDEFDTLDTSIWKKFKGTYAPWTSNDGKAVAFSDSEEALYIKDGKLIMKPFNTDDTYYGAAVESVDSVWFQYGILEGSFKFNNTTGLSCAFWTLGFDGEPVHAEFDLFESLGSSTRIKATPLAHANDSSGYASDVEYGTTDASGEKSFYYLPEGDSYDDGFHTIGIEWTPTTLKWVYDGQVFITVDTTSTDRAKEAFNSLQRIIITQNAGVNVANKTGWPDQTTDWKNAHFTTDYVRLYQTPNMKLRIR